MANTKAVSMNVFGHRCQEMKNDAYVQDENG